jgi:hypothetical protein
MFFWSQNILWKEDLLKHDATVFLCGKDSIIDAPKVRIYLEDVKEHDTVNDPDPNSAKDPEKSMVFEHEHDYLEIVWCADLDHGGVFDQSTWRGRLKAEVLRKALCAA